MKKRMSTLCFVAGLLLVAAGFVLNVISAEKSESKATKPPAPKDGEMRIVDAGTGWYRLEKYVEHPGWRYWQVTRNLEEARAIKAAREKSRSAVEKVVE